MKKLLALSVVLMVANFFVFSTVARSDDSPDYSATYRTWDKSFKELLESVVITKNNKPDIYGNTYSVFHHYSWDKNKRTDFKRSNSPYLYVDIKVVPQTFSVHYGSYMYSDGQVFPQEECTVTLSYYVEARILYSDNTNSNPDDVLVSPLKTFFEVPAKITIPGHIVKKEYRELLRQAAINHKALRLKGVLYVSPRGTAIEKVRQNWQEHGFWFWPDSVEEVVEETKEATEKKNDSN